MGAEQTVAVPPAPSAMARARGYLAGNMLASVLWVLALGLLVGLCAARYRGATAGALMGGNNIDFRFFFRAAELVSEGRNPFATDAGYVYFAPLALLLYPFAHTSQLDVLRGWTVLELAAFAAAVVTMTCALRSRLGASWHVPIFFAICTATGLHFWPMTFEFLVSNDDIFVLLLIVAAAASWKAERPLWFGIAVGAACLIKVWPVLLLLAVLQVGIDTRRRVRAVAATALVIVIGLVTNLIPAGAPEFRSFFTRVFHQKSQQLVSDSIGGIPRLLFSNSGLARPVTVSSELRYLLMVILGLWVVGMLVLSLRTRPEPMLCVVNTTLFAILVIPVSHLQYTILALPVLWYWVAQFTVLIDGWRRSGWSRVVTILLVATVVGWYLVQTRSWPGDAYPPSISAVRFCVVFAANLALFSASVLAGWFLGDELDRAGATASTQDRAPSDQTIPTTPALRGPPPIEP